MAAVTQQISSYLAGVSKEPDIEMKPGYVDDAINVFPDFQFGLMKRPGTAQLVEIGNEADYTNSFIFLIRIVNAGDYVGIIRNASQTLEVYNLSTGAQSSVVDSGGSAIGTIAYLNGSRSNFETTSRQKTVLILNKTVTVAANTAVTPGTHLPANTVNSAGSLPYPQYDTSGNLVPGTMPATGVIFKVLNISGAEDDYFVKWSGVAWEETVKPGISTGLDPSTLPYLLEYVNATTFRLTVTPWNERITGDNTTNPFPSFTTKKINNIFRYKERLVFLSEDEIIMSRPLDNYNFFRASALTATDGDPIDLQAASNSTVDLFDSIPTTQGLIVFSSNEQFIMTAGTNGTLTPSTAALRSVSKYSVSNINIVEMNGSVMFCNSVPGYTRVFSMYPQGENNSPILTDISKIVTTWIPSGIDRMTVDNNNSFIALFGPDSPYVYYFRTYSEGQDLKIKSWFRWEFPGNVQSFDIINDVIFVSFMHAGKLKMASASINPTDNSFTVKAPTGDIIINPCLDLMFNPTSLTYNDATDRTYLAFTNYTVPTTADPDFEFTALTTSVTSSPGLFWRLLKDPIGWYITGDITSTYTASQIVVGFTYKYIVNLPTTFMMAQAGPDYTASLTISRYKVAMGLTGNLTFMVAPRNTIISGEAVPLNNILYSAVGEVSQANFYQADSVPIEKQNIFSIPIHKKNNDFDFQITSDSPFPSSLLSLKWEGVYSPRFYNRS